MSISVVIPSLNGALTLARAIRSCHEAGQIIVVDNGSTDSTSAIALDLGCRVVRLAVNAGFSGGVNAGMAAATGDYRVVLGDDDWFCDGALAALLAALDAQPDAGFAYGGTKYYGMRVDTYIPKAFDQAEFRRHFAGNYAFMFRRAFWDCGLRFRGEIAPGVGFPDWEFVLQMLKRGASGIAVQRATLHHLLTSGRGSAATAARHSEALAALIALHPDVIGDML